MFFHIVPLLSLSCDGTYLSSVSIELTKFNSKTEYLFNTIQGKKAVKDLCRGLDISDLRMQCFHGLKITSQKCSYKLKNKKNLCLYMFLKWLNYYKK